MYSVLVDPPDNLVAFQAVARRLLASQARPADVDWSGHGLFADPLPDDAATLMVPRDFLALAGSVACHRHEARWDRLYQALWRLAHGERKLMAQASDALVHNLRQMETAVQHDLHRMTAFVRFRSFDGPQGERFIAWYEPAHRVLRRASSFFVERFAAMPFSLLTPDLTLHWDQQVVSFGPGLRREDAVSHDAVEAWWERYYASTFNPARLNERLLTSHMPRRFWRNLPETRIIAALIEDAGVRTDRMIQASRATESTARRNALGYSSRNGEETQQWLRSPVQRLLPGACRKRASRTCSISWAVRCCWPRPHASRKASG
jgi:uracil-DNA glycosylase